MSGNICAATNSPSPCSKATTTSSTNPAPPGASSPTTPNASPQSHPEPGRRSFLEAVGIIQSRRRLSFAEYLSLLAIIVIIVQWGFIAGILIGVVIGGATFALSAARIDSIKYGFDGSEYRSSLDRSRGDQALLAAQGAKIQGMTLPR